MNEAIIFLEHGDECATDKPHCSDCGFGVEFEDKPHCSDCGFGPSPTQTSRGGDFAD